MRSTRPPPPPFLFPSPSHVDPLWFRCGFANAAQPHTRLTQGGGFWAPEDLKRRAGFQSCVISSGVAENLIGCYYDELSAERCGISGRKPRKRCHAAFLPDLWHPGEM